MNLSGFLLIFSLLTAGIFFRSITKVRSGKFYSDTPELFWMGVYVWGDALVLAPAWTLGLLSAAIFGLNPVQMLQWVLLFLLARSFFEVMYWLNHQAVKAEYCPPLLRNLRSLTPDAAAITYQLAHTVVVVITAGILLFVL